MRSLLFVILFPGALAAQFRLAEVFSDGMILQQGMPVSIWGKGIPGAMVEVTLGSLQGQTVVDADSAWILYLASQPASREKQQMTIVSGTRRIILQDILFGDIWVCIGQSNIAFPLEREEHWPTEKSSAQLPLVRFLDPVPAGKNIYGSLFPDSVLIRLNARSYYNWKGWQVCDSGSARQMSAVAYYFARKVHLETGIPIGMIHLGVGGAPLESFIRTERLAADPVFGQKLNGNWLYNTSLPVWVRERGLQNLGSNYSKSADGRGPGHPFKPCFIYEAGIRPLLPLPIRGILCYQGESNAQEISRVNEYAELSALMVNDLRAQWRQPDLPFYYVQLSSIDTLRYRSQLWPEFREEQRKMMQLISHSGMAVSSDIGARNDVHPLNKKDVGERLARWALIKTYQHKGIPTGPLPGAVHYRKHKIVLRFKYAGHGLRTRDGGPVKGFSIEGTGQVSAELRKRSVVIFADHPPMYVYYGWKPFSDGNLVNSDSLPASTFQLILQ